MQTETFTISKSSQLSPLKTEKVRDLPPWPIVIAESSEESPEMRFQRLLKKWHEQIGFSSSEHVLKSCPAFLEILEMDTATVAPLVIKKIRAGEDGLWVSILEGLYPNVRPGREEDRGNSRKLEERWLKWWENQC